MSKKQFEHMENKFREAAENFQPSLNEAAWKKMELLLDQENEKKRRPAGIWFSGMILLLLTGGLGTYFHISNADPAPARNKQMVTTSAATEKTGTAFTPETKVNPPLTEAEKTAAPV